MARSLSELGGLHVEASAEPGELGIYSTGTKNSTVVLYEMYNIVVSQCGIKRLNMHNAKCRS